MRGVFVFLFSLLISQSVFADARGQAYDYCIETRRETANYCNCMIGKPYNVHLQKLIDNAQARLDTIRGRYQQNEERLLADPTINKAQMEQVCAVANEVYIMQDSFLEKQKTKQGNATQFSQGDIQGYGQAQRQATQKMGDMLRSGRMSSPVYRALFSLSGFCKSRYDVVKMEKEHIEYERAIKAGEVDIDAGSFFYKNKAASAACR
ncbi:MAG: hypothetical protein ACRBCK_08660 [Alphaproteobacteria bacterium]